ncbi:hypothetical protein DP939_13810 [Spongiactinospora rosea]|uniref:DoxX family protein n=1 Tax=Spongiactinospora rosea TaxID=2248750 RepID=A0A366M2W8_9ACTN|nr:DoxX family protein [Spongiactinospora rosea]RBQ19782.1 hypothetical protein DP939_13810 [Spongiactinospora rosea]
MSDVHRTLHDLASLAARLGVGGIFFATGWHKLEAGLTATAGQFATLQAPAPQVWAAVTMLTELIGGALLVAGLVVGPCGLLLFAEALAVFVIASGDQSLPLTGDVDLIIALGAASILLSVGGAGRLSVDHMVVIKRREAEEADDFAADAEADHVLASWREADPAPAVTAAPGEEKDKAAEPSSAESGGPARAPKPRPSTAKPPEDPPSGDTLVAGARDTAPQRPPARKPGGRRPSTPRATDDGS